MKPETKDRIGASSEIALTIFVAVLWALLIAALLPACNGGGPSFTNPPKTKPDVSSVVYSDISRVNENGVTIKGWIKGWVPETAGMNVAVVCKHSNPFEGAQLFTVDASGQKHSREVVQVLTDRYNGLPATSDDYYGGGDISICRLDEPWPATIKGYKIATSASKGQYVLCFRNDGRNFSASTILMQPGIAWMSAHITPLILAGGDSGLPWFVHEGGAWKVVSHFARGADGQGPNYADAKLRPQLVANIEKVDSEP